MKIDKQRNSRRQRMQRMKREIFSSPSQTHNSSSRLDVTKSAFLTNPLVSMTFIVFL